MLLGSGIRSELEKVFNVEPAFPRVWEGVRKLNKGKPLKRVSQFASVKNKMGMPVEGGIELSLCYHLEWLPSVTQYRTQPFTLELGLDGKYTPDFLVQHDNELFEVVECKFSGSLGKQKVQNKIAAIKLYFKSQGIQFTVMTEKDFQSQSFHNLKYLYGSAHYPFTKTQKSYALQRLKDLGNEFTYSQAKNHFKQQDLLTHFVNWAMFHRLLMFDVSATLCGDTTLRVKHDF